jgi:hypothetical protein
MRHFPFLAAPIFATLLAGGLRADDAPKTQPSAPPPSSSDAAKAPANFDIEAIMTRAHHGGGFSSDKKYQDFAEVTKGAEKIDGLFTLHKKDEHLYAEIKPFQFDQPLLVPATIARGIGQAGMPVGDDDMVLVFRKHGDKVQVVRRNIRFKAPPGTPIDKSVKQNYTDSVLMALPIVTVNPMGGMTTVIDLSDIFLTDFAQLGLGYLDRNRSGWHRVKGFPNNLELEVEATFGGGGGGRGGFQGNDGVADHRGITVVIHYSLMRTPDPMYRPRAADDRVGHFLSATKDFGKDDPDTNFVRYVNRWRLEKSDARAKMSPPKKQIVWWVEDTVPVEYRPYVEAGIREWNKAFEKIGFREAIAVRWQDGRDEFDPEDTNYCTFRWVTSDAGFAMSCLRANPLTGEMIDGDVVFDASFLRHWKQEYALLVGAAPGQKGEEGAAEPLAIGELISPAMASKMGYGQPGHPRQPGLEALGDQAARLLPEVIPSSWGQLQWQLSKRVARTRASSCQFQVGMQHEFNLIAMALADAGRGGPGGPGGDGELPEEFLSQALKEVVMHEVGHSLGLRHNFKASAMLTPDQLHDTTVTRAKGLVASVMDYSPVNLAPKGKKQGDYYTTTLGPYDYWAIEYAYKPLDGNEEMELKKIAARAPEPELLFATDEDSFLNNDPQVNLWDLGSDPCAFAKERIALATELIKDLDTKVVKDGESWSRNRRAFGTLMNQWGNAAHFVANYVGGQSIVRHHKGDKGAGDPVVPVPGAKQRECLKFLVENVLSDKAFQFSPALLRRLVTEKWMDWSGSALGTGDVSYPILERVLDIQRIALGQCLNPRVLSRLQNQELQADPGTDPLRMEEVFRALSGGVFSDLEVPAAVDGKPRKLALTTVRRNLQREYVRRLNTLVLGDRRGQPQLGDAFLFVSFGGGGQVPADARALARLHLKEIAERIAKAVEAKDVAIDDTTRAHLEECRQRIGKVLEAPLANNEP